MTTAAPRGKRRPAARVADAAQPIALDSSCWMEFFADTERADLFARPIAEPERLVVPVLTIHEVVKKLAREAGDEVATAALSLMQRGRVVDIDLSLALEAAVNGLPMADSLNTRRSGGMAPCCGRRTRTSTGCRG